MWRKLGRTGVEETGKNRCGGNWEEQVRRKLGRTGVEETGKNRSRKTGRTGVEENWKDRCGKSGDFMKMYGLMCHAIPTG